VLEQNYYISTLKRNNASLTTA